MLQLLIQNEQGFAKVVQQVTDARHNVDSRKGTFLAGGTAFLKKNQLKPSLVPESQEQNHAYLMEQLQRTKEMEQQLLDLTHISLSNLLLRLCTSFTS